MTTAAPLASGFAPSYTTPRDTTLQRQTLGAHQTRFASIGAGMSVARSSPLQLN